MIDKGYVVKAKQTQGDILHANPELITTFDHQSAEFESHGLKNVTLQHRNVCKEGFGDVSGVEAGQSLRF